MSFFKKYIEAEILRIATATGYRWGYLMDIFGELAGAGIADLQIIKDLAESKALEGGETVSEKEKDLLKNLAENLDKLPELKKGEFIGYAKCMADLNDKKEENENQSA